MKWLSQKELSKPLKRFFLVTDGGKEVVSVKRLVGVSAAVIVLGAGVGVYFSGGGDTSVLAKTAKPLNIDPSTGQTQSQQATTGKVSQMLRSSEAKNNSGPRTSSRGGGIKINYKAQQVLVSEGVIDPNRTIPMGTNLIGKTLTTIDTRDDDQLVKVLLPYGGRANTGAELPSNTILFGKIAHNGKGEKVFIKFNRGLLPSGEEFALEAQGLNPKDYSPGLVGKFHGNADMRVATALGLTMVAGMADVLTEKESMGNSALQVGAVTPKATMKNALYQGASRTAQSEANRQAESIGQEQEYVTVDAGTDVIVSLTKAFVDK